MGGLALELEGGVGDPAEGDRQPEVDRTVGQYAGQCLTGRGAEPGDHRHEDELDHTQPARGDGYRSQDVGQSVGGQQVDGGDEVAEGGHEHPQRCRVEEPVGCCPPDGPPGQRPILHQPGEPQCQPFHQRGGAVGVEEPDPPRDAADHAAGALLTPGQQIEESAEGSEQHDADRSSHDDQDRAGVGLSPVMAGRSVEAVDGQEPHQGEPEQHIEHHR